MQNISDKIIITGIKKIFNNAGNLLNEAKILLSNKCYARAYTLSQLSLEECGKIHLLIDLLIGRINKETINYKKLMEKFYCHQAKTELSLKLVLTFLSQYSLQNSDKNVKKFIIDYINKLQNLKTQDNLKNESLYVGFQNGIFITPPKSISRKRAEEIYSNVKILHVTTSIVVGKPLSFYKAIANAQKTLPPNCGIDMQNVIDGFSQGK